MEMKRNVSETVTVPEILGILISVREMTRIVTALKSSHSTRGRVATTCRSEYTKVPRPAAETINIKKRVRTGSGLDGLRSILLLEFNCLNARLSWIETHGLASLFFN